MLLQGMQTGLGRAAAAAAGGAEGGGGERTAAAAATPHRSSEEWNPVVQGGVRSLEEEGDRDNSLFGSRETPTGVLCSCSCRLGEPPQTLAQCQRWAGGEAVTAHPAPLELTSGRRCRSCLRPG